MPRKISYIEFIEKCKECEDFENISFEYIDKENFNYCTLQKLKCKKHNKIFYRVPKLILRNINRRKTFICNDCRIEYITPISISNRKSTKYKNVGKSKQIIYTYSNIIECLNKKNINVKLISPIKKTYTNKDILNLECKIHGTFQKNVQLVFRSKWICNKCNILYTSNMNIKYGEERRKNFIKKAIEIHGDEYDYSKVDITGRLRKIPIICRIHGIFTQMPSLHLRGEGCPLCNKEGISNNERRLGYCLKKRFPNLEILQQWNGNILKRQKLDYYIPKYKIGIEYQGPQHFINIDWYNDYRHSLEHRKELDKTKYEICKANNIHLIYFTFNKDFEGINYLDRVYTKLEDLYDKMSYLMTEYHNKE